MLLNYKRNDKRNDKKRYFTVLFLLVWSFTVMTNDVYAGGGGITGNATEWTQLANNAELIVAARKATEGVEKQILQITNQAKQIAHQIEMIKDMAANTLSLPSQIYGDVMRIVNRVKGVYENTKGVIFSMRNINGAYRNSFRSYSELKTNVKTIEDFDTEYVKISEAQQETITSVMEAIGIKYDQYTSDAELLSQLQRKAESAEGRNQILQAANQLNAFAAQQLLELREIIMLQTNAFSAAAEAERARSDLERAKVIESRRMDYVRKHKKLTF